MRALKIATVVMGILIVVGTMALVIVVARRSAMPSSSRLRPDASVVLGEPAGTRIIGIAAVQDRLAVLLQGGGADRIVLVDPANGNVAGHIVLAQP